MAETITLACPRACEDGDTCEADVDVALGYERGEWYGADADGNRGEWRDGFYYVCTIGPRCSKGHELTDEEEVELVKLAAREARNHNSRDY